MPRSTPSFAIARSYLWASSVSKMRVRIGRAGQPAVGEDLAFQLAGAPAGVAERQHRLRRARPAGDGAQDVEGRRQTDVVGDLDRRVGRPVVGGMQHEAASGLDRPAANTRTASARGGRRIA